MVATPKTIAYNKHSEKSSVGIRTQKSLNQIPSEMNNFEIQTNESGTFRVSDFSKEPDFFMQYSRDKRLYEKRLQEDRELLRKKGAENRVRGEETQSERGKAGGLVDQIRQELSSERGTEFKELLMQVMQGFHEPEQVGPSTN